MLVSMTPASRVLHTCRVMKTKAGRCWWCVLSASRLMLELGCHPRRHCRFFCRDLSINHVLSSLYRLLHACCLSAAACPPVARLECISALILNHVHQRTRLPAECSKQAFVGAFPTFPVVCCPVQPCLIRVAVQIQNKQISPCQFRPY